jgi:hypothetical protein
MDTKEWLLTIIAYALVVQAIAEPGLDSTLFQLPLLLLAISLPIFMLIDLLAEVTGIGTWKD